MLSDSLFDFGQVIRSRELGGRHYPWVEWDLVSLNARLHGGREALVDMVHGASPAAWRRRTWAQALEDTNTLVFQLLERGLRKGGLVLSQLPNSLESVYLDWATSKIGAMHCGLNLDLGRAETLGTLEKLRPDVAVIVPEWHGRAFAQWYREARSFLPSLRLVALVRPGESVPEGFEPVEALLDRSVWTRYAAPDLDYLRPDPLDVHELLPTSGTTGVPKISQRTTVDWFHVHSTGIAQRAGHNVYDSRILIGPLSGGSGRLWAVHVPLFTGGRTVLPLEFDEENVLEWTERERITIWSWNPALITRVVTHPAFDAHELSSLRQVSYSGAPLPSDVIQKLYDRGIVCFNVYGTSEVGGCMSPILSGISQEHLMSAAGVPFEGFDVAVVDGQGNRLPAGEVGEILIWNIHHGYFASPEESRATFHDAEYGGRWEGYQHTGDLGVFDDDGYLRVVGRKKDMILRGGQNIFPKEVEDILSQHPSIRDIAVVAMPDPILGERACAFVVPVDGTSVTVYDLAAFLDERGVAKFKAPERVEVVEELPLGPGGKVLKGELRELIRQCVEAEAAQGAQGPSKASP
ncbi:MAG: class I adenylate-forming enzyme family protein [Clostridia bacterium]